VEDTPSDPYWGAQREKDVDEAHGTRRWIGKNHMGLILTGIRERLFAERR